MRTAALLLGFVVLVAASESDWQSFKLTHSKSYVSVLEENTRYGIFLDNLKTIEEHNRNYVAGLVTWKMGVNQFADMTQQEFKDNLPSSDQEAIKVAHATNGIAFKKAAEVVPSSVDWRTKGAVTEVKTQRSCGACWAFSATGSLEGQYFIKNGQLLTFSEQNLIDCINEGSACSGCTGGVSQYYDYVRDNGIETESDYPATDTIETCKFNSSLSKTSCKGYINIDSGDEDQLLDAVGTVGPVSVGINAENFQFYTSGIYSDTSCSTDVNHGVLAVGYDSEEGVDYWIIKNSWGPNFGENGYMRILRGKNVCGVALFDTYPIL